MSVFAWLRGTAVGVAFRCYLPIDLQSRYISCNSTAGYLRLITPALDARLVL